ncbi:MAG: nuclear transport factor 2 family protein [Novosphingobium sp.]|nr:nuclear transport factor 2 family protein [Novosphingobium sp.]
MPNKQISAEDYIAIANMLGEYQHLVDAGDEVGWSSLFTEDGEFRGLPEEFGPPEMFRGKDGLKLIAKYTGSHGGMFRHHMGSFTVGYGDNEDEAYARYYILALNWSKQGAEKLDMFTPVTAHLVRTAEGWKVKSITMAPL